MIVIAAISGCFYRAIRQPSWAIRQGRPCEVRAAGAYRDFFCQPGMVCLANSSAIWYNAPNGHEGPGQSGKPCSERAAVEGARRMRPAQPGAAANHRRFVPVTGRVKVAVFGLGRRRKPGGTAKLCLRPCKTTQRRRLFYTLRPIIKEVCDHG